MSGKTHFESMIETKTTNTAAENFATEKGLLPLGQMALIGTIGTKVSRRALIRLPSGSIRKVSVGDVLRGSRIDAIEPERLLMSRNGHQTILEMPRG